MMLKPEKLYKASEILEFMKGQKINISRQTLHNYTLMSLVTVARRTSSGHRLYNDDVFEKLLKIETLKRHHPLWEVKKLLGKKQPIK
jgi:DNA-binding transcriptional MerR regulator